MRNLFLTYRALAFVVGVLLVVGTISSLMKYLLTEGSDLQQLGDSLTPIWLIHGWVFMVYVVVSFLLARRAGWSVQFTLLVLAAGLVPLLIFWVEHVVTTKLRAEHPELVAPSAA